MSRCRVVSPIRFLYYYTIIRLYIYDICIIIFWFSSIRNWSERKRTDNKIELEKKTILFDTEPALHFLATSVFFSLCVYTFEFRLVVVGFLSLLVSFYNGRSLISFLLHINKCNNNANLSNICYFFCSFVSIECINGAHRLTQLYAQSMYSETKSNMNKIIMEPKWVGAQPLYPTD